MYNQIGKTKLQFIHTLWFLMKMGLISYKEAVWKAYRFDQTPGAAKEVIKEQPYF